MLRYLLPSLLIALLLSSCGPNYVFEEGIELPVEGWIYSDSLVVEFTEIDTVSVYNLHLILEHSDQFSYQNFYALIHTTFPNGQRTSDPVSLELAGKGGVWLGECSGTSCTLDIPLQQGVFFPQLGTYRIVIQQHSRVNPLPAIQSLRLALEDTGENRY